MGELLHIGSVVIYVDEHGMSHKALITAIHNQSNGDEDGGSIAVTEEGVKCAINLVCMASDPKSRDSYGRQVERWSSVQGKSSYTAHGRYWQTEADWESGK